MESITKIKKSYILNIEAGEFEKIPGEVYLKGFLRTYAKLVDLNPDEIITNYEYLREMKEASQERQSSLRRKRARQLRKQRMCFLLIVLALGLLGIVTYLWFNR